MSNCESDGNQAIFPPSNCWLGCHFILGMPQNICLCFSNFTMQTNDLWVLSNSTFCFSRSGVCQRPCISNKLPGDTDAVGWDRPFSNGYKFVMVAWMPPSPIFSCPPPADHPQLLHPSGHLYCQLFFLPPFLPSKWQMFPNCYTLGQTTDVSSFIHSLSKHLLSPYFTPGMVLHMCKDVVPVQWDQMQSRCYRPNTAAVHYFISLCEEYLTFLPLCFTWNKN